jgi:hypothetical protein
MQPLRVVSINRGQRLRPCGDIPHSVKKRAEVPGRFGVELSLGSRAALLHLLSHISGDGQTSYLENGGTMEHPQQIASLD